MCLNDNNAIKINTKNSVYYETVCDHTVTKKMHAQKQLWNMQALNKKDPSINQPFTEESDE
jgi:hypothetical protein